MNKDPLERNANGCLIAFSLLMLGTVALWTRLIYTWITR